MSIDHNRIKVSDLETNQPNKTLITNQHGELEFSDISQENSQNLQQTLDNGKSWVQNITSLESYLSINDSAVAGDGAFVYQNPKSAIGVTPYSFLLSAGTSQRRIIFRSDLPDALNGTLKFELPKNKPVGDYILATTSDFKTIDGASIIGTGNIDLSNKQDISNQIEVGTSQSIPNAWHGKTVLFTASCTLTVPTSLVANFIFNGITLPGVTITWVITAPHTWLFGTPAATTEKQIFTLTKRGATNSILLLGI
ncbi:hypothetical protein [uncultured Flavobacterium sp.]|uniref:hypothetical protein n=1 Tax=uncultured Flavobacterium sp. TaxID=165435 RepID=UPI00292DD1D5|nr:hypothetical protein [uncultured Flavobacterium sp.]